MHEQARSRRRAIGTGGMLAALAALSMATAAIATAAMAADAPTPSPYAGEATSPIKALSPAEVEDLLAGRGMGFAKAAELNHYPGPRHVLDLGEALALTAGQRGRTEQVFAEMQTAARDLGQRLVAAEAALDALFAAGQADEAAVTERVARIARLAGELRLAHLAAHLEMRRLLDPAQIALYDQLRGYGAADNGDAGHQHEHGG